MSDQLTQDKRVFLILHNLSMLEEAVHSARLAICQSNEFPPTPAIVPVQSDLNALRGVRNGSGLKIAVNQQQPDGPHEQHGKLAIHQLNAAYGLVERLKALVPPEGPPQAPDLRLD